jgi:hypothetical protein
LKLPRLGRSIGRPIIALTSEDGRKTGHERGVGVRTPSPPRESPAPGPSVSRTARRAPVQVCESPRARRCLVRVGDCYVACVRVRGHGGPDRRSGCGDVPRRWQRTAQREVGPQPLDHSARR